MLRTLIKKLAQCFQINSSGKESSEAKEQIAEPATESGPDDGWKHENQMPEYEGDGKECLFCKSVNVRTFLYGLIRFSSDEKRKEALKTSALGGCCIDSCSQKYICDDCDKRFGRAEW